MTRFTRSANGKYVVSGKSYDMLIGSRAQVWHGTAFKTTGGLTKAHLMQNKTGRIVSKSKHNTAKREKRLVKAGYGTKKGKFGYVKIGSRSRSRRGGSGMPHMAEPAPLERALMAGGSRKGGYKPNGGRRPNGGSRKGGYKRGGGVNYALSPSPYDGQGVGTSGNAVQFAAGMGN